MAKEKLTVALIVTVLNESATIDALLASILKQTIMPDEVFIVDGGSSDDTLQKLADFKNRLETTKIKGVSFQFLSKKGNRSVGRNCAIQDVHSKLIAITDAGCVLHSDWLEQLLVTYDSTDARVISGYYVADAKTKFQAAVVPYVLVMPDQIDANTFLPATRSMLMEKSVWLELDGFDERLDDNEDYAFARKMVKKNVPIAFAQRAVVSWMSVSTLPQFSRMIFRFAKGDVFSGIVRPRVVLLFNRYVIALILFYLLLKFDLLSIWVVLFLLYIVWSIIKNYRYASRAWYWLPVLQITADFSVMIGSIVGMVAWFNLKTLNKQR